MSDTQELFYERQRRVEAELRAAILKAGEQDITIARLREELEREREKFNHENRLAGHLATEVGKRDCEIEGLRHELGLIVVALDEGWGMDRVRNMALTVMTTEVPG